jgi:hypothetical protein
MAKKEILEKLFGDMPYKTLFEEITDFAIFHLDTQELFSVGIKAQRLYSVILPMKS